jgi:two-component system, sensor histidine kinase PdtaS
LARYPDIGLNLALAIIESSTVPLLLLDGELTVLAASRSFLGAFECDPDRLPTRIGLLGSGEWDVPQLRSLLRTTLSGHTDVDAYEFDLVRGGRDARRLVLTAQPLDYGDANNVRVLLTIVDVTVARAADRLKDDLVREKATLLLELQHRVANSLQIIASVLMMSARRVQSDETRTHLYDAHNRVLSVAAVQRQLATTRLGDVHVRPYLTELCESIGASMIRDRQVLHLDVHADQSIATPDVAMSLGLLVTELTINALKHAFPGQRGGHILVDYVSNGPNWQLSVSDDGVGFPQEPSSAKPGLGTSIVKAIASQLHATVAIRNAKPGTSVSIAHNQAQLASADDERGEVSLSSL